MYIKLPFLFKENTNLVQIFQLNYTYWQKTIDSVVMWHKFIKYAYKAITTEPQFRVTVILYVMLNFLREDIKYIHTHIHIHTYILTYTYMHTYVRTYIHIYIHTYTTQIHKYVHIYIHTYINTYVHICALFVFITFSERYWLRCITKYVEGERRHACQSSFKVYIIYVLF